MAEIKFRNITGVPYEGNMGGWHFLNKVSLPANLKHYNSLPEASKSKSLYNMIANPAKPENKNKIGRYGKIERYPKQLPLLSTHEKLVNHFLENGNLKVNGNHNVAYKYMKQLLPEDKHAKFEEHVKNEVNSVGKNNFEDKHLLSIFEKMQPIKFLRKL